MSRAAQGRGPLGRLAGQLRGQISDADERPPARTAILIVNGFDRHSKNPFEVEEAARFPWIRLCLQQVERFTPEWEYQILVWDNSFLPEHSEILEASPRVTIFSEREKQKDVRHGRALDRLMQEIPEGVEYVITLDTDSFPIRHGWLDNLIGRLDEGAAIAGIWRNEMSPHINPYVHPSCLAARIDTLRELGVQFARNADDPGLDVGQALTEAALRSHRRVSRLYRSNVRNVHYLMGGVYGDLMYHHGAGSRRALFWTGFTVEAEDTIRVALRDASFSDLDGLLNFLTGND